MERLVPVMVGTEVGERTARWLAIGGIATVAMVMALWRYLHGTEVVRVKFFFCVGSGLGPSDSVMVLNFLLNGQRVNSPDRSRTHDFFSPASVCFLLFCSLIPLGLPAWTAFGMLQEIEVGVRRQQEQRTERRERVVMTGGRPEDIPLVVLEGGAGTAGAGIGLVDLQDTGTPTGYFFKVAGYLKKLECCKGPECNTSAKAIYQAKANLEDIVCVCCAACASPGLTSFKCTYVYHRLMGFWHLGHVIRLFYLPR